MFNSVAKYLWGGAENESEHQGPQENQQVPGEGECQEVPVEECGQEDDWVLVSSADKENSNIPVQHHYHHQLHHHHNPHPNHHQSHHSSLDFLSQHCMEVELLDDAASLVHHIADPSGQLPLSDCENKSISDPEDNGLDSGVRPSSPDSVFSACSGRSSATYRPRGSDSEAWVVAPPPCFTGSQCGSLSPVVASPLENLLIEHPSMSVYVSQTSNYDSSVSIDCQPQGMSSVLHISGSTTAVPESSAQTVGNGEVGTAAMETSTRDRLHNSVRERRSGDAAVHQRHMTSQKKMKALQHSAQRKALCVSQLSVSNQKCRQQNLVRRVNSAPKGRVNHKNKQMCPSGFKSSRIPQRNTPRQSV